MQTEIQLHIISHSSHILITLIFDSLTADAIEQDVTLETVHEVLALIAPANGQDSDDSVYPRNIVKAIPVFI